jgi:hypothetical protein
LARFTNSRSPGQQRRSGDYSFKLVLEDLVQITENEASADHQSHRHRGAEVAAGDVADGIDHPQHRKVEGERDAEQADANIRKGRREHGAAAAAEDKPEGADAVGDEFVAEVQGLVLSVSGKLKTDVRCHS